MKKATSFYKAIDAEDWFLSVGLSTFTAGTWIEYGYGAALMAAGLLLTGLGAAAIMTRMR